MAHDKATVSGSEGSRAERERLLEICASLAGLESLARSFLSFLANQISPMLMI